MMVIYDFGPMMMVGQLSSEGNNPIVWIGCNSEVLWFQVGIDPIGGDLWRLKMTKSSVKFRYHMHESMMMHYILCDIAFDVFY